MYVVLSLINNTVMNRFLAYISTNLPDYTSSEISKGKRKSCVLEREVVFSYFLVPTNEEID